MRNPESQSGFGSAGASPSHTPQMSCQPRNRPRVADRSAFTLIELLVAVGILVILTTMTIATLNVSFDAERLSGGARQIQSYLAGARDRAIYAKEARGVRFLLDSVSSEDLNGNGVLDPTEDTNGNGVLDADNSTVSSMVFIGAVDDWTQGRILVCRPNFVDTTGAPGYDTTADAQDASFLIGIAEDHFYLPNHSNYDNGFLDQNEDSNLNGYLDTSTDWHRLHALGLLQSGTKIKLKDKWYTIDTAFLSSTFEDKNFNGVLDGGEDYDGNNRLGLGECLRITPPFQDIQAEGDFTSPVPFAIPVAEIRDGEYRLKLAPRVLPNQEPVQLPRGIVVDLDYSRLPATWQPSGFYSYQMDLMFSPQGTVTGAAAVSGVIHFLLNDIVDTTRALGTDERPGIAGVDDDGINGVDDPGETGFQGSDDLRPVDFDNNQNGLIEPEEQNLSEKRIITLFTRTGHISKHRIFETEDVNGNGALDPGEDVNGNNQLDPRGSDVFFYAETGETSQ